MMELVQLMRAHYTPKIHRVCRQPSQFGNILVMQALCQSVTWVIVISTHAQEGEEEGE